MNDSNLLSIALDAHTHKTTIKLKIAVNRKTYEMLLIQQPNWLGLVCMGNRTSSAQQVKYVGNIDVFFFGFYFMSPKWTGTKIVIGLTLLLHA